MAAAKTNNFIRTMTNGQNQNDSSDRHREEFTKMKNDSRGQFLRDGIQAKNATNGEIKQRSSSL